MDNVREGNEYSSIEQLPSNGGKQQNVARWGYPYIQPPPENPRWLIYW